MYQFDWQKSTSRWSGNRFKEFVHRSKNVLFFKICWSNQNIKTPNQDIEFKVIIILFYIIIIIFIAFILLLYCFLNCHFNNLYAPAVKSNLELSIPQHSPLIAKLPHFKVQPEFRFTLEIRFFKPGTRSVCSYYIFFGCQHIDVLVGLSSFIIDIFLFKTVVQASLS